MILLFRVFLGPLLSETPIWVSKVTVMFSIVGLGGLVLVRGSAETAILAFAIWLLGTFWGGFLWGDLISLVRTVSPK